MSKGVEKIGLVNPFNGNIIGRGKKYSKQFKIKGGAKVDFEAEYYKGTPDNLKGNAKWVVKPHSKSPITKNDKLVHTGDKIGITIPLKFCGPKVYIVEAFRYSPANQYPTMIEIMGQAPYKIISTKWSKTQGGSNIKNGKAIKYGDDIWLNIETEGLNGSKLDISVYCREAGDNRLMRTYYGVMCYSGEVNLHIKNTFLWKSKIPYFYRSNIEEFFIIVRLKGNEDPIVDNLKDFRHAVYLKIKDEVSDRTIEQSTYNLPLKTGKSEVIIERYEPCSFDEITISEPKKNPITIFNRGKNLTGKSTTIEIVKRSVYFKYDSSKLSPDTKGKLNDIIDFLTNNKKTNIQLNGWASIEGKEPYNLILSQKRADAVKDYFIKGGLDGGQIVSKGKGELKPKNANDEEEKKEDRDEKKYSEARKVEILFHFNGQNANALVYNTVAGSKPHATTLSVEIENMLVKHCYKDSDKHEKKVIITSPDSKKGKKDASGKFTYPVFSNLPEQSDFLRADYYAPLNYIWPSSCESNNFYFYINSCRYFHDKNKASLIVKVYPDIKWTFAVEVLIGISNYKAANMPEGNLYAKHNEAARKAGYDRWLLNKHSKLPITVGFGLSAEWNNGASKRSITNEFKKKIKPLTETFSKAANIFQKAVNSAQGIAKSTALPVSFDIRYPKIVGAFSWYIEKDKKTNRIATIGEANVSFEPLIGASVKLDLIGLAIAAVSGGNPAVLKLASKFRGGLNKMGGVITFTVEFTGDLEVFIEALKIDSINGIDMLGKGTIGGKFGVIIEFDIGVSGKLEGSKKKPIYEFKAALKGQGYFGGYLELDSDNNGIYIQPILKFSGIIITGEISGEIGWWKTSFKMEERVMDKEEMKLSKKYFL